jgi:hypothetical protein
MTSLKQSAIVAALAEKLRESGSWCGETHLQKAAYFLATLFETPLETEFVMYKHGPFSFDLRELLGEMRAREFIELEPQPYPYGPRLAVTSVGTALERRFPKTLSKLNPKIDFVSTTLGDLGVADLERLATALYIGDQNPDAEREFQIDEMVYLKPHISRVQADEAFDRVYEILEASTALGSQTQSV